MRITNKEQLTAHGNREGRKIVAELLDAGLDALDPYVRVKQLVHVENGKIVLHTDGFEMKGDPHAGPLEFDLKDYDRVYVIGAAKGVQRAALAMEEALGDVLTGGHVIAKHGEDIICNKIGVTLAGHPVPDEACVEGCKKIEALARDITSRDLVFTITGSGCGSLMTYPADDITIDEIARFTHMMQIEKGVPTSNLNPIRTHIDRFKGGRLSRLFRPATLVHMTTADPSKQNTPVTRTTYFEMLEHNTFFPPLSTGTTYADCIAILQKWNAWDKTPVSIQNRLLRGTPEAIAQFAVPVATLCTNYVLLARLGDMAVNAYSIICYVASFSAAVFIGVSCGLQPLFGQSYGARDAQDLKWYFRAGVLIDLIGSALINIVLLFVGGPICRMFGADAQTLACTVAYMPRYAWGFIIMSVNTLISAYLYSTKRTKQAVILNLCRSFLLDSVIIFAVPAVFGGNAVWLTMGIYEALALLLGVLLVRTSERGGITFR